MLMGGEGSAIIVDQSLYLSSVEVSEMVEIQQSVTWNHNMFFLMASGKNDQQTTSTRSVAVSRYCITITGCCYLDLLRGRIVRLPKPMPNWCAIWCVWFGVVWCAVLCCSVLYRFPPSNVDNCRWLSRPVVDVSFGFYRSNCPGMVSLRCFGPRFLICFRFSVVFVGVISTLYSRYYYYFHSQTTRGLTHGQDHKVIRNLVK
jgi:hypothetical protein